MDVIFGNSWLLYGVLSTIPLFYWYATRKFNFWSKRAVKGPKPLPIFGNILSYFTTARPHLAVQWQKLYGTVYGIYSGNRPVLIVAEPELIKQICVKDFNVFTDRNTNSRRHPILSRHLVAETGDDWKRIRSIVTPTFSSGKMKKMYPMIRQCLDDFVTELDVYADNKKDVNIKTMYGNYTMDVISCCAFATKTNSHKDPNDPFIINAQKVFAPAISRLLSLLLLPTFVLKALNMRSLAEESANEFFFNITRHIMKERKTSNKKYNDFIELLMNVQKDSSTKSNDNHNMKDAIHYDDNDISEAHHVNEGEEEKEVERKTLSAIDKYITEDEILAQSWVFFVAGYETTATTLTFASYELALNPICQQRLYEEVIASTDAKGEIDYEVLARLPYLDAVISETLRLHSPAIILIRQASEDYKLGDTGITLEKGQQLEIPIYAVHHNEDLYEKAESFIPERFLPENRHKIKPYSYIPFGAGPRNCIGMRFGLMEAKLALAQVIKRYQFLRTSNTDVPLLLNKSQILHSPKRVILRIEKRL